MDRELVEAVKREFREALFTMLGRFPESATPNDLYLALALAARREVLRRWVRTSETYYTQGEPHGRATCRPSTCSAPTSPTTCSNLGARGRDAPGDVRARLRPRPHPRPGGGAGPRQRRARPARRVLHGLARDARDPRDRLRHPLRVRHLRPGDPRRLAGREDRQVAGARQPVGDPAARDRLRRRASAAAPRPAPTSAAATSCAGCPSASCAASPTTRRSSATATAPPTCCGCGRPRPPSPSTSRPSTSATTGAPSTRRWPPRTSQGALPERRAAARQAAAARAAVLLRLVLAPGHDPHPPAEGRAARRASPRSTRCSSTTPTRRSPSPS